MLRPEGQAESGTPGSLDTMKRTALTLALVVVVAACGDDDSGGTTATTATPTSGVTTTAPPATDPPSTTAAPTTTPPTTDASSPAALEITSVSFGDGSMVVITNVGDAAVNLGGHWLCQRPAYFELPEVEVGPGQSFAMSLGGSVFVPPPGAITVEETASLGAFTPGSGELGLYSSSSFGSADAIVSYVEWGTPGHGRSGTAVEAGIWVNGGFVETTDDTVSIDRTNLDATGPDAWTAG